MACLACRMWHGAHCMGHIAWHAWHGTPGMAHLAWRNLHGARCMAHVAWRAGMAQAGCKVRSAGWCCRGRAHEVALAHDGGYMLVGVSQVAPPPSLPYP
eukprot:10071-Chlamydomonas_euryale.AAC.3